MRADACSSHSHAAGMAPMAAADTPHAAAAGDDRALCGSEALADDLRHGARRRHGDRDPGRAARALEEGLVDARAVDSGAADRRAAAVGVGRREVAPVDVTAGHRDAAGVACAGDETLVDGGSIEARAADGVGTAVCPVDVGACHGDPGRAVHAGNEALVGGGAVDVRPADRAAAGRAAGRPTVGPEAVAAVDRYPPWPLAAGDEVVVD